MWDFVFVMQSPMILRNPRVPCWALVIGKAYGVKHGVGTEYEYTRHFLRLGCDCARSGESDVVDLRSMEYWITNSVTDPVKVLLRTP